MNDRSYSFMHDRSFSQISDRTFMKKGSGMDHREHYRKAQAELAGEIARVGDAELELVTPCTEWTVRDLLRHVVAVNYSEVEAFAGRPYDAATDARLDGDPRERYPEAAAAALEVLTDDTALVRTVPFADQDRPGWVRISFHFLDAFTHIWDLRRALNRPGALDPELAEAGIEVAGLIPNEEWVRGPGKPFGRIVPVADDAPAVDRMLGLVGRSPDWAPAPA